MPTEILEISSRSRRDMPRDVSHSGQSLGLRSPALGSSSPLELTKTFDSGRLVPQTMDWIDRRN